MKLDRREFIATITMFFCAMSVVQIPTLAGLGILTPQVALLSAGAMIPLFAGMPVGAWLAQRISKAAFDRLILVLLAVIALKLIYDAIW